MFSTSDLLARPDHGGELHKGPMTWLDLLLFTGAVYGCAWGISKSGLLAGFRDAIVDVPLFGKLVQCIVCTGTWVALALVLLAPYGTVFSSGFPAHGPYDVFVLVAWSVGATWAIGRLLGDAWLASDHAE